MPAEGATARNGAQTAVAPLYQEGPSPDPTLNLSKELDGDLAENAA